MPDKKMNIFKKAKARAEAKKIARYERLKQVFPFNLLRDMWHGITGEPK